MEQFRCYGCMQLISEPVCPHCGHPREGTNRPEQLSVGTVLHDRYLVGRAVDRNGEGLVYVGLDQSRDRTVNIREFFPADCARREGTAVLPSEQVRFDVGLELRRREASLLVGAKELAQVSGAVDAFEENGTVYLVLDQVKGPSLGLYARRRGGVLDPQEALRILRGVIGALAVLHQNGFAHGGVTMENIILDPMGGARLLGFGENRSADPADDVLALSGLICASADPAQLPGLTEQQQMALRMGLCPDPKERFSSAVALRRALFGEVTLPIGPLAPLPKAEPEMPRTEAIQPEPEMPRTEAIQPEPEMPRTEAIQPEPEMPRDEAVQPEPEAAQEPEEESVVPPRPVVAAPVIPPVSRMPATEIVSEFKIRQPVSQPEPVPAPAPEPVAQEMPRTEAAPVQSWEPQQPQWEPPQQWDVPPQPPQKPKKTGLIVGIIVGVVALLAVLAVCFFTVHIWEDASCDEPKTCVLCGKTQGKTLEHKWEDATCAEPETCRNCGETQGDALGHDWKTATCEAPKACATCGATEGEALPHDWKAATCEAPKTCRDCGITEGSAGGHDWKAATCTDPKTCRDCGETSGSALGHSWKDATYTDPKTCTRCGATEGEPKGYLEYISGDFQRFVWGSSTTSCYVFDSPVYNCKSFNLYFKPTFNYNAWVDDWKLLYQDTNGTWHEYSDFTLNTSTYEHTFNFSPKLDIKAIAVVPRISGTYSYSFSLGVWDVYYTN